MCHIDGYRISLFFIILKHPLYKLIRTGSITSGIIMDIEHLLLMIHIHSCSSKDIYFS